MLQIKNITKTYQVGEFKQKALKGVNIDFRQNEFVAILGESGSGKTTLLNIIGGLDRYDSGDLIINGISTKEYTDKQWDAYRNHTIGFVFQSYNLISHQSVLSNVELSMTLSGVSKSERISRAKEALEKVGLKDHINKKPNQLSGGQMQRVAIARALVNNPDILLADEPTGALDSQTSVQIMDLLKEIASDRLVIMVTHNPELAHEYANRIVRLKDGEIIDDTKAYESNAKENNDTFNKVSMSKLTALSLSFNNLKTKKARTLLTAFAGSIGIIGIALILALSSGMNDYITDVQKETMSSYPIEIEKQSFDTSMFESISSEMSQQDDSDLDDSAIHVNTIAAKMNQQLNASVKQNNLTLFKEYLDDPNSEIHQYVGSNGIVYDYLLKFKAYSIEDNKVWDTDTQLEQDYNQEQGNNPFSVNQTQSTGLNFSQLSPDSEGLVSPLIKDNFELVSGQWPTSKEEGLLVLNVNNALRLQELYQLGLITKEQVDNINELLENDQENEIPSIDYQTIFDKTYYLYPTFKEYQKTETGYELQDSELLTIDKVQEEGLPLKVVGVIKPINSDNNITLSSPIVYTKQFTDEFIKQSQEAEIIKEQLEDPTVNVLNGVKFEVGSDEEKADLTKQYLLGLPEPQKAQMFQMMMLLNPEEINPIVGSLDNYLNNDPSQTILLDMYDRLIGDTTYENVLDEIGYVDLEEPTKIQLYTDDFSGKEGLSESINNYNENKEEADKITYTDFVALLTSSITSIINGISYVLIAFVAVSLIVSSIMIGIITHISVLERTKEIGILRALGASKKNISQVFNAETFIIGLLSGILGIVISYLLLIPINRVINNVTDIDNLKATLMIPSALLLIALSVIITLIGGLIPAKKAAKKDPVIALRTE